MEIFFDNRKLADLFNSEKKLIQKFGSENGKLIVEPCHDPLPKKPNHELDLTKITAIKIVDVEDYH